MLYFVAEGYALEKCVCVFSIVDYCAFYQWGASQEDFTKEACLLAVVKEAVTSFSFYFRNVFSMYVLWETVTVVIEQAEFKHGIIHYKKIQICCKSPLNL